MTSTPHSAVAARRARVRRIRTRVAAGTTALFLALFSGLYVQLASGNDPVLGAKSAQVGAAGAGSDGSSTGTSTDTGSAGQDDAPVTTSAS